ncbi:MAG: hypothetical protein B7Y36_07880 [Novosphingobium sp. 28-62-57]|uniref:hypothetical protein n=1 Tax=unclassified Novosphingobium TaxID=2644732 RepID=UPI000BC4A292|nr:MULTISPECIES: hypothetical protein [unclassified Novosphingobium]OYW47846.1 MAG: hypothetical protein B7Z36_00965 [Novosphingobium sp. 12-63-9]OYZ10740.1 MAG: hypothetical protein B7Y36_07880 [Novosphingobium sp. 28-62-57]OZA40432.1 MAG: hypothetical protein B7X92_01520 [Novosphingobium sp. 17-62-9]HQS68502.1 hypothetical protein [Novosphingobium sp.]
MNRVRTSLLRYRTMAFVVILAALFFKALIPAGTMVMPVNKVLTVALCDGMAGNHAERDIVVPMKSKPVSGENQQGCAFSALGMAMTGSIDPVQLLAALAFVLALAFAPWPALHVQAVTRLRPPLRAPPVLS